VIRKQPDLWKSGGWVLRHDNVPVHLLGFIQKFPMKHGVSHLYQPSHNPGRVTCDLWLFPKLKTSKKKFEVIEKIKANVPKQLLSIKKNLWKKIVTPRDFFY